MCGDLNDCSICNCIVLYDSEGYEDWGYGQGGGEWISRACIGYHSILHLGMLQMNSPPPHLGFTNCIEHFVLQLMYYISIPEASPFVVNLCFRSALSEFFFSHKSSVLHASVIIITICYMVTGFIFERYSVNYLYYSM